MRQIIKKEQVRVDEAGTPARPSRSAAGPQGPAVELVRVDGRVQALEVRCACGEVTVIELAYGDETPDETNP